MQLSSLFWVTHKPEMMVVIMACFGYPAFPADVVLQETAGIVLKMSHFFLGKK
jgi:hypothetical protein